jgi:hypothetical protein
MRVHSYTDFLKDVYMLTTEDQSQSHIATDGQSVSKSWCRTPSGVHDQIFITVWQLGSCFCGAPSLTRGRVCLLYMLLVLASAVFLGSESLGTDDHILLPQIWDFPFRRLLRLTGSRWRYSTPPPHGLRWGVYRGPFYLLQCISEVTELLHKWRSCHFLNLFL